jgi:hypothetical protein
MQKFQFMTTKILAGRLEKSLFEIDKKWWEKLVLPNLTESQMREVIRQGLKHITELDLSALLRIFYKNFYQLSKNMHLPLNSRQCVKNMQAFRNRWAHTPPKEYSKETICRDLDIIIDFLRILKADKNLIKEIIDFKNRIISPHRKFVDGYDKKRIIKLCNILKNGSRGVTLGKEILSQLNQGYLKRTTYDKLSRWVNPRKPEYFAQPISAEISRLLFSEEIPRYED